MSDLRYKEVEKWIDFHIGSYNYFGIRSFVKSAADNELEKDYPQAPFTAKEVLEWAIWNDEESFFLTPGAQAIEGEKTSDYLFGAPKIDPLTNTVNSKEAQNGVIVEYAQKTLFSLGGVVLTIGGVLLLYKFASAKVTKLA